MEFTTKSILFILIVVLIIIICKKKLFKHHEFYRKKDRFYNISEMVNKIEPDECRQEFLKNTYSFVNTKEGRLTINNNENAEKKIKYMNKIKKRIGILKDYMYNKYFINKILSPGDYMEYSINEGNVTNKRSTKTKEQLIKYYQCIYNNLKNNFIPDNFIETIASSKKGCSKNEDTSFVIGKGDVFSICMENKSKIMHDFEFIFHVALHELGHLSNIEKTEHDSIFYNTFYTLKRNAFEANQCELLTLGKNTDLEYCDLMKITETEFVKSNPPINLYIYYDLF